MIALGDLLACSDNVAASGVLDPDVLRDAQEMLNGRSMVVGIPGRSQMLAAPADMLPEQLASFARLVARMHLEDDRPITPLTFYASEGFVHGIF